MSRADAERRARLRDLAERYAAGVDRRDTELFLGVFHPDARLLVFNPSEATEPIGTRHGHAELAAVITRISRHDRTFHLIGNARYDLDSDDEHATGEVYCIAHHLDRPDGPDGVATDHVMYIRYRDDYRREDDAFLILERRVLVDWTETRRVQR